MGGTVRNGIARYLDNDQSRRNGPTHGYGCSRRCRWSGLEFIGRGCCHCLIGRSGDCCRPRQRYHYSHSGRKDCHLRSDRRDFDSRSGGWTSHRATGGRFAGRIGRGCQQSRPGRCHPFRACRRLFGSGTMDDQYIQWHQGGSDWFFRRDGLASEWGRVSQRWCECILYLRRPRLHGHPKGRASERGASHRGVCFLQVYRPEVGNSTGRAGSRPRRILRL